MNTAANINKRKTIFTPARFIVLSYIALILAGAILLSFPFANSDGEFQNIADSLFNATGAVCVTGLTSFRIADHYTLFGQIVILVLIQIGGLGFMTITTMMFVLVGKRISLKDRLVFSESMNEASLGGLIPILKKIVLMTLIVEALGAIILFIGFYSEHGVADSIYYALFHAISAFCNAGIDVLPSGEQLYQNSLLINITIMSLVILGGLGYIVIFDLFKKRRWRNLNIHTKIVLIVSGILLIVSTLTYYIAEHNNPLTLAQLGFGDQLFTAFFMAVNSRTAGFSFVATGDLMVGSRLMYMLNMFIGGGPASTAGGIKTTTVFVLLIYFVSTLRGKKDVHAFKHTISTKTIGKSVAVLGFALIILFTSVFALSFIEQGLTLDVLMFDVVSTLGTVGLSIAGIASYSAGGRIILALLMLVGRIGILSITMVFVNNRSVVANIKYVEGKIMVG